MSSVSVKWMSLLMDIATDLLDTHMVAKAQLVGCMNVYVSVHVSAYVSVYVCMCAGEKNHIISPEYH